MNLLKSLKLTNNGKYASFWSRFLALFIDRSILNLPFVVSILLLVQKNTWEEMLMLAISIFAFIILPMSFLSALYYPFFLSRYGKTIGKAILGLKLVDQNGKLLSFKKAIFREYICKAVSFSLVGFGFFAMWFDKDCQTWHDKLAGTYVYQRSKKTLIVLLIIFAFVIVYIYFCYQIFLAMANNPLFKF